jgi:hypothetical protein
VHAGQDKGKQEELKKNLKETNGKHPEKELFFFDESLFDTHSKVGHGWFKKGVTTEFKIKYVLKTNCEPEDDLRKVKTCSSI